MNLMSPMGPEGIPRRAGDRRELLLFAVALVTSLLPSQIAVAAGGADARLAIIGDYGSGTKDEAQVAALVSSWDPDAIITVGDNNYPSGAQETIDRNVGRYYHEFIGGYAGAYGGGAERNRFFPALGNHDWMTPGAKPYLDYFDLPGNERYYDVAFGPVRFFVVDSDPHEPDGISSTSKQAAWLHGRLSTSTEPWRIIVFHHPPYSSGKHGGTEEMRWPFREWGATAVIAGHDHDYERIVKDGFPFFVCGFGGGELRSFNAPTSGSEVRYASDRGAMRVDATTDRIEFQAVSRSGQVIDTYEVRRKGR